MDARWVDEKPWVYRNEFDKPEIPAGTGYSAVLVFDGLDTFARVKLDGKVILMSSNMFIGHRVDITEALQGISERHVLEIEFDSALIRAREIQKQYPDHIWASFNGDSSRMGVRKAQYHWGWDWGPVLMTAGIWRDVRLEVYWARIQDLYTHTDLDWNHKTARVTVHADIESVISGPYKARFTLRLSGKEVARNEVTVTSVAKTTFVLEDPSLWWPRGYGSQALYEVSVSLVNNDDNEVHQVSKRFGIRTAEVIQQDDKYGKSFFFRINGFDIFCGGSCWIPADSLLPNISSERYRKWVELLAAGNQIMVR